MGKVVNLGLQYATHKTHDIEVPTHSTTMALVRRINFVHKKIESAFLTQNPPTHILSDGSVQGKLCKGLSVNVTGTHGEEPYELCLGLRPCPDGTAKTTAQVMNTVLSEFCGSKSIQFFVGDGTSSNSGAVQSRWRVAAEQMPRGTMDLMEIRCKVVNKTKVSGHELQTVYKQWWEESKNYTTPPVWPTTSHRPFKERDCNKPAQVQTDPVELPPLELVVAQWRKQWASGVKV